ncbi:MAG: endo-1,4-beta-xylanase [Spirochaetes bacterium]|nr:endo-1,4-beta-xylanase [Spirochaetota bacterium]
MRHVLSIVLLVMITAAVHALDVTPQVTNIFYGNTPGIFRADEGTIEFRLNMKRPMDRAQNTWDFIFSMIPGQQLSKNARTLIGIYVPPIPDRGLRAIFRDGSNTRSLAYPGFSWIEGKPFLVSLTWGKALRLYVDGRKVAELNERCSVPDALVPTCFMVDQDRFSVESMRLSSVECDAATLWTDTSRDFTRSADTTFIAAAHLTRTEQYETPWSAGYSTLKPLFRERYTCLDTTDDPVYPLIGFNGTGRAVAIPLHLTAADVSGKTAADVTTRIALPAGGGLTKYDVPVPALKKHGYYKINAVLETDGQSAKYRSTVAVFPARAGGDGKLAHWLGQHYEEQFDLVAYRKAALMTLRAGGRNPFMWPRVEPEQGVWDWSLADEFVAAAEREKIEVLGLLGWTPRWAGVEPADPAAIQNKNGSSSWKPRSVEEFGNYVYQAVARYKGRVPYWEIWNEVDWHPPAPAFSFTGSTEEYFALLKEAYQQAKRADPSCKVLISGFGLFGDKNMPRDLMSKGAGAYFDIFNFHAYAGVAGYLPLKELISEKKPGAPSWNSEHMWHEMSGGPKRDYLSVASLLWFMEKGVERYYYMGMSEYYFDRTTSSPSIEYWVVGYFQSMLRTCDSFAGLVKFDGASGYSVRHMLKKSDGTFLSVLGSELGEHEIIADTTVLSASDLYGNNIAVEVRDGRAVIPVKTIAYIMTAEPLRIVSSRATVAIALYQNGSFEDVGGDIAMGGLAAGKPLGWTFRDTAKDPEGKIVLSDTARSGKFALKMSSSGKGSVYAFQDVRIPAPGMYTVAGYFKNTSGSPQVYMSYFDRSANKIIESVPAAVAGDQFAMVKYSFEVVHVPSMPCALIFGIKSGEGSIILDDIAFAKDADGSK